MLMVPAVADAQGHRGVHVARPSRTVVVGAYHRPFYYNPWYFSPYSAWYPPYYGYAPVFDITSSLRLQVMPRETEVFIDGYYAGTVDEFDGFFQRLRLEPGEHHLELYLPGHRNIERKIYLQPGGEFRLRYTMEPIAAGDAEPVRPVATPPPTPSSTELPPAGPPGRPVPGRPRPRPSNVESGVGELSVRVQPGEATITIDGEQWEGAPDNQRLLVQLGAGPHRVEIRKDGYRPYSTEVTIRNGETATLNVALTRPE